MFINPLQKSCDSCFLLGCQRNEDWGHPCDRDEDGYYECSLRTQRASSLARVKELESAINEFFDCDDLWIDGICAGEAAEQLKRLVGRQTP